jgi:hypothetical protein
VPASNLGPGTGYAENSRNSDQLKYLGVGERIILKWILRRRGRKVVSWIHLTLDMGQETCENVMNFRVSYKTDIYATL